MPIDLSAVNWAFVGLMALLAFVAALLGSLIAFRNRFFGAIIAGDPVRRGLHCLELLSARVRLPHYQDYWNGWRSGLIDVCAGRRYAYVENLPGERE